MKIVLDTNVLLQCIGINSLYRPIWDAYLNGKYDLSVSVEIIFEYWEKLESYASFIAAKKIASLIFSFRKYYHYQAMDKMEYHNY